MYAYVANVISTVQVNGIRQRQKVGEVHVPLFDLLDFGLYDKPATVSNDGHSLTYDDPKANVVQQAIIEMLMTNASNALQPGTASLKPGARIDTTINDVIDTAQRRYAAMRNSRR